MNSLSLQSFRRLFLACLGNVLVLFALLSSPASHAGVIAVFSDINSMNVSSAGRNQMLSNLLGSGTNVLVSKQNGASYPTDFAGFYNTLSGVTASSTSAELTAGSLSGVNLLFLNFGCCSLSSQNYSSAEIAVMTSFLGQGGSIGMVYEPCCGGDMTAANAFLAALGSSMSFGTHVPGGSTVILSTFLTTGVTGYVPSTFNEIVGGVAAVTQAGKAAVAYETVTPVPEPAALGLLGLGLVGLGLGRRRMQKSAR